jgi:hypothetical protein
MPTNHRTNVKPNKPFKGRHATKSALKEKAKGRLPGSGPTSSSARSRSAHQPSAAEGKQARRNHARQLQQQKRSKLVADQRLFAGRQGVPRVVCVVELGDGLDARRCVRELRGALGEDVDELAAADGKDAEPVVNVECVIAFLPCTAHRSPLALAARDLEAGGSKRAWPRASSPLSPARAR